MVTLYTSYSNYDENLRKVVVVTIPPFIVFNLHDSCSFLHQSWTFYNWRMLRNNFLFYHIF